MRCHLYTNEMQNTSNLTPGTLLKNGEYRIEQFLGQGGFGITYAAVQVSLGRKVAIKEFFMKGICERNAGISQVSVSNADNDKLVSRYRDKFLKEARNIASLEHPNIVPIIDVFECNGTAYYVMKHFSGASLAGKVFHGALPEEDAVRYTRQVADALDFVHSKRMMHLDVKPANILLDDNDNAVLIDFGLAKQYDTEGHQTSSTPVGISHGYAPLEQYKRGGVSTFSPATDIYSLGATLFKLVTGITPPEASDVNDEGLPALPQEISAPVRRAIEAAMQPKRKDRPQSVGEFLSLLESTDNREQSTDNREQSTDNREQSTDNREQGEGLIDDADVEVTVLPDKRAQRTDNRVQRVNAKAIEAESEETRAVEKEPEPVAVTNNEAAEPKKNHTAWVVAVLGVLIGCGLFFAFSGGDSIEERSSHSSDDGGAAPGEQIEEPAPSSSVRTFTVEGVEFKMVAVKGGTFQMGATSEQQDTYDDERPVHSVTLSDYYIGETEVTQALWQAVMGSNPSNFTGNSQRPVESVSWNDCQTFISRLNSKTGMNFRLPTEAEWEYAARGGNRSNKTQYSGSSNIDNVAWYDSNSGSTTHPVKGKSPNELGLYDMSGNVWEWCSDWYSSDYYSNSPRNNPQGPSSGSRRVLRGGSWGSYAQRCRVACRDYGGPDGRRYNGGLRLAL